MADQVVIQVTKNDYDIMPENCDFFFLRSVLELSLQFGLASMLT
jgi:hypothetical protein